MHALAQTHTSRTAFQGGQGRGIWLQRYTRSAVTHLGLFILNVELLLSEVVGQLEQVLPEVLVALGVLLSIQASRTNPRSLVVRLETARTMAMPGHSRRTCQPNPALSAANLILQFTLRPPGNPLECIRNDLRLAAESLHLCVVEKQI